MRTSVDPQLKQTIVEAALNGESPGALAQKHNVAVQNIYNWMKREKDPEAKKNNGSTNLAMASIDEQITALTAKYQKDLKALLLKQVMQTLHAL